MAEEEKYDEAQEEAAIETGFNAADDEPEAVAEATETTPDDPAETPTPEPAAEPEPQKYLSLEEFNAAITAERAEREKLTSKVFGKVGELQQRLDTIRSTASGISPKAKERLAAEFPELAEMLFDGADEAPAVQPPAIPTPAAAPAIPAVDPQQLDTLSRQFERKLLTRDHRDWEQVVQSNEFSDWKSAVLSPEDAAALDESWDADFVSAKLTQFKEWRETQMAPQAKPKPNRLDAAVIPRGIPRSGLATADDHDEEAAMVAAFGNR